MKTYWFILRPDVYVSIGDNRLLLYNTKNGEHFFVESIICMRIVHEIYEPENNGSVKIDFNLMEESEKQEILLIANKGFGSLYKASPSQKRPMVLLPILSLRRDADREIGLPFFNGRNLLSYLTELTLVIQEKGIPLKPSAIDIVLSQLVYSSRKHIIVEGDKLPDYPYWAELKLILANYNNKYTYKVRYNNPIKNVGSCSGITLFVDFPVDYKAFQTSLDLYGTDLLISFQIQSEHDYDEAWLLIERNSLKKYEFIPKYNGNNRDFFQRYVFLKEHEIFSKPISFREIFCHQKINTHYFGKLIVFPDGSVKTAKYSIIIGNISQDPVAKLVYKEMKHNTSWRKIRNEKPCCNCLYQFLCPSPSDYEIELGLTNLCHVYKR